MWNPKSKSCDAYIADEDCKAVIFHPFYSVGTSAIRGTKILNNSRSYWEIFLIGGLGSTSLMFGIGTKNSRLGTGTYTDLIGEDENSWGLSHKGLLRHCGKYEKYCRPFRETFSTNVGLLFDGIYGTLTYFKDGINLGIAFWELNKVKEPLYPIVSSTYGGSIMVLRKMEFEFISLQDRCKSIIIETFQLENIKNSSIPITIQKYLEYSKNEIKNTRCEWYVPRF